MLIGRFNSYAFRKTTVMKNWANSQRKIGSPSSGEYMKLTLAIHFRDGNGPIGPQEVSTRRWGRLKRGSFVLVIFELYCFYWLGSDYGCSNLAPAQYFVFWISRKSYRNILSPKIRSNCKMCFELGCGQI